MRHRAPGSRHRRCWGTASWYFSCLGLFQRHPNGALRFGGSVVVFHLLGYGFESAGVNLRTKPIQWENIGFAGRRFPKEAARPLTQPPYLMTNQGTTPDHLGMFFLGGPQELVVVLLVSLETNKKTGTLKKDTGISSFALPRRILLGEKATLRTLQNPTLLARPEVCRTPGEPINHVNMFPKSLGLPFGFPLKQSEQGTPKTDNPLSPLWSFNLPMCVCHKKWSPPNMAGFPSNQKRRRAHTHTHTHV